MNVRLRAAERREQLLAVVAPLLAERGYHGVSMDELADAAGVTKPVLYQHFRSKQALYLAVVSEAAAELETQVRKALVGTEDNRARVEGAIGAYVAYVGDPRSALLFGSGPDDGTDRVVARTMATVNHRVAQLIAADAGLDEPAALLLSSALRGLATEGVRWSLAHPGLARDEVTRLLARLAWRGIGSFEARGHGPKA